ncbi:hypothetical protein CCOS865_04816 [Pseudomonas reidholzensis]|uniref:Uncharacterized protein n=1 Tax=Pseudomonas reidholzensis TaxID=1785162 RepID=A0A383RZS3_9PSED|nr:hypothetical protein [Pseudomonas reidholzensis]SYX92529.1 hypothetical protein CCOS865_04816 [Pseudomonas reidholzensis]
MKLAKHQVKPLAVLKFEAEARLLAGHISVNQLRFLQAAKDKGAALEPAGRIAGSDE